LGQKQNKAKAAEDKTYKDGKQSILSEKL